MRLQRCKLRQMAHIAGASEGKNHRHRAQSLVEFAIVVPIFLTVLFGIIEFGWAIYSYNTIQHAAKEGVRRAIVLGRPASNYTGDNGTQTGTSLANKSCNGQTIIGSVVCNTGLVPLSKLTVDVNVPNPGLFNGGASNVTIGTQVSVVVKYAYQPIIPYPINKSFEMAGFSTGQTQ